MNADGMNKPIKCFACGGTAIPKDKVTYKCFYNGKYIKADCKGWKCAACGKVIYERQSLMNAKWTDDLEENV